MAFGDTQILEDSKEGTSVLLATREGQPIAPERPEVDFFYKNQRTGRLHVVFKTHLKEGFECDIVATPDILRNFKHKYDEYLAMVAKEGDVYPLSELRMDSVTQGFFRAWGITNCNQFARLTDDEIQHQADQVDMGTDEHFLRQCRDWRDQSVALVQANSEEEAPTEDKPKPKPRNGK